MFKKAQMSGPRKPVSLLLGIIFLVLGLIPLLNAFGAIGFTIPLVPTGVILWVLALIGGIILLWDAISEGMTMGMGQQVRMLSLVGAVALLIIGVLPILNSFGMVSFVLPPLGATILNSLFTVVGILLLYGGMQGY